MFDALTRDYAGYIFDCDGTLADSMVIHHRAWQSALRQHGARIDFHWELFTSRAGMSLPRTVLELNEQFGLALDPIAVSETQRAEYWRFITQVQPLGPVTELARRVAAHAAVSVASGGERVVVLRTLEIIGMADVFRVIVTAEDVEHGKPAPDSFLLAASRMGVPPAECVVFEDSPLGILAAERAGMASVLVQPPSHRLTATPPGGAG